MSTSRHHKDWAEAKSFGGDCQITQISVMQETNRCTAHVVAAAVGIKHVMAEVLPAGKAEQVKGHDAAESAVVEVQLRHLI